MLFESSALFLFEICLGIVIVVGLGFVLCCDSVGCFSLFGGFNCGLLVICLYLLVCHYGCLL